MLFGRAHGKDDALGPGQVRLNIWPSAELQFHVISPAWPVSLLIS